MTRYRYYTATTVDGFLADENDSLAWLFKQDTAQGGGDVDVGMMGGGDPAAAFASAGMLDEGERSTAPVLLGSGRRRFGRSVDLPRRTSSRSGDFLPATLDVVGPLDSR